MSRTAREFVRLVVWCDWQEEVSGRGQRAHPYFLEACAKVRRDAAYLIGFMA